MTEQDPESATPNIFAQLEQVFIDSEVDKSSDYLEFDIMSLESEAKVLDLVASKLPKYAAVLAVIKNNQILLDELIMSLGVTIDALPREHEQFDALLEVRQLIFIVAQLANEWDMQEMQPEQYANCREYQRRIAFDPTIAYDDKIGLIEVTRILLNGDGMDISNADDMLMAMKETNQQEERSQFERGIRVKAKEIFEHYLDSSYEIMKTDPEYRGLVTFVSRYIATRVTSIAYEDPIEMHTGTFTLELLIEEPVVALGLSSTDIIRTSQLIVDQLVKSS